MATRDEKIDQWIADAATRGITVTREEVNKILDEYEKELKERELAETKYVPFVPNRAQRRAMAKRDRRDMKKVKK